MAVEQVMSPEPSTRDVHSRPLERTRERRPSPRALSPEERAHVLAVLNAPGFVDLSPAQIYARRLDDGIYDCSIRTFYRIFKEADEVRERWRQR